MWGARDALLRPPLVLRWQLRNGLYAAAEKGGLVFVPTHSDLCAVEPDGRIRWRRGGSAPFFLPDGCLVVEGRRKPLRWGIDAASGKTLWEEKTPVGLLAIEDRFCVAFQADILRGSTSLVVTTLPPGSTVVWQREFACRRPPGVALNLRVAVHGGRAFLLDTQDPDDPAAVAFDLSTGGELWRHSFDSSRAKPHVDWDPQVVGDQLVFRTQGGVAALDLGSGRAAWRSSTAGHPNLGGNKIAVASKWEISILDARTGKLLVRRDLKKLLLGRSRFNCLASEPIMSAEHIYVGDALGTLWGLDGVTAEPVWDSRPEGTVGNLRAPSVLGGCLYVGDYTDEPRAAKHLFCWEPLAPGEVAPAGGASPVFECEGELPFSVEEVAERRRLTRRVPYHEKGGAWTVYRCRVGQMNFYVADRVSSKAGPVRGAEAALWVASATDGDGLLRAFRNAMPDRRVGAPGAALRVKPPTLLKAIDLASEGHKQRRKWLAADGSELLVYWNSKSKEGKFMEKDPVNRKAFLEVVAGLVAR